MKTESSFFLDLEEDAAFAAAMDGEPLWHRISRKPVWELSGGVSEGTWVLAFGRRCTDERWCFGAYLECPYEGRVASEDSFSTDILEEALEKARALAKGRCVLPKKS